MADKESKLETSKASGRGGKREGAGRKKGDKKQQQIWCSDVEKEYLLECLEYFRKYKAKQEKNEAKAKTL